MFEENSLNEEHIEEFKYIHELSVQTYNSITNSLHHNGYTLENIENDNFGLIKLKPKAQSQGTAALETITNHVIKSIQISNNGTTTSLNKILLAINRILRIEIPSNSLDPKEHSRHDIISLIEKATKLKEKILDKKSNHTLSLGEQLPTNATNMYTDLDFDELLLLSGNILGYLRTNSHIKSIPQIKEITKAISSLVALDLSTDKNTLLLNIKYILMEISKLDETSINNIFKEKINSYTYILNNHHSLLCNTKTDSNKQIELKTQIAHLESDIEKHLSYKGKHDKISKKIESEIHTFIEDLDSKIKKSTAKFNSQYDSIIEKEEKLINKIKRSSDNAENLIKEKNDELFNKINELGNILASHHQEEIKKANQYLEERKKEIDHLVGIASEATLAGNYEKHAQIEASKADGLRNISFLFMFFVFLMVTYMFFTMPLASDFKLDYMLSRLGLFFVLSIPAAYLSRESTKHRQQEIKFKQLSLDMKALSPFVAPMPEEQQIKIKTDIANRVFFTDQNQAGNNSTESFPLDMNQLITPITTGLGTAISKLNLNADKGQAAPQPAAVPPTVEAPVTPIPQATAEAEVQTTVAAPAAPAAEKSKDPTPA